MTPSVLLRCNRAAVLYIYIKEHRAWKHQRIRLTHLDCLLLMTAVAVRQRHFIARQRQNTVLW